MRIVYLGINKIGQRIYDWLIREGENVVALITTKEDLRNIKELKPDLIISAGFRHIIEEDIILLPKLGCINLHKSLLPYNRGANPNVWTILENTLAGVTIHFIDQGVDTGDILAQREVLVDFYDTARTLYEKLEDAQFDLFIDFWPEFKVGKIKAHPQANKGTFHQIKDFKRLRKIDPDRKYRAIDLINQLRAMTFPPFNNCYIKVDGDYYFLNLQLTKTIANPQLVDTEKKLKQYPH